VRGDADEAIANSGTIPVRQWESTSGNQLFAFLWFSCDSKEERVVKVTDIWSSGRWPTVYFELFRARPQTAAENLERSTDVLVGLNPYFVSVTFGAERSTREGSCGLVEKLKSKKREGAQL